MLPGKKFAAVAIEIRIILIVYLFFLATAMFYLSHQKVQISFNLSDLFNPSHHEVYQLQEWEGQADQQLFAFFKHEGILVHETRWELREKGGVKPVQWAETNYRLGGMAFRATAEFQQRLDDQIAHLGIVLLSDNQVKLNGKNYLCLNYGITWSGEKLVTHRLFFTLPDQSSSTIISGFTIQPKKSTASPEIRLKQIQPVPKTTYIARTPVKTKPVNTPEPAKATIISLSEKTAVTYNGPRVAIIIDDLGFVKEPAEAYFQIKVPLTVAVLPGGPYSKEQAILAAQAGFQVLLHQPLEPIDRLHNNPGPGVIDTSDVEETIRRQFEANLADVPGAVGFNNHMGSAGTQNKRLMTILLSEAKQDGLFFIDSRSIGNSVGESVARQIGIPHAGRQVFLDNSIGEIRRQLDELKQIALRDGSAIGIAHARPGVAQVIAEYLPVFEKAGIKIVHVSELLH